MDDNAISNYCQRIRRLRNECLNSGISEEEFKEMYLETLASASVQNHDQTNNNLPTQRKKKITICVIIFFAAVIFLYNYGSVYACLLCNLQEYIYPGLKWLRRISIPFISLFPSLTALYHETCLVQNPFFNVADMDCWPCSLVSNVRQVYNPSPITEQPVAPFIYASNQKATSIQELNLFYLKYQNEFEKESNVLINNYAIKTNEMFNQLKQQQKMTYIWKFNTMTGARLLRQLIPRPQIVPKFGQSTERFLIIDTSFSEFRVPDTECSNSFFMVLSGNRQVQLKPADECKHQCKSLNVDLTESFVLWYNWWYWRPVVQTTNGNETFIAHVGSYC